MRNDVAAYFEGGIAGGVRLYEVPDGTRVTLVCAFDPSAPLQEVVVEPGSLYLSGKILYVASSDWDAVTQQLPG